MQRIIGSWRRYFNFVWDFLMECFEKIVSVIQENELIRLAFLCTVVPVCLWFVLSIFLELPYSFNIKKYKSHLEYTTKYKIPRYSVWIPGKKDIEKYSFKPKVSNLNDDEYYNPNHKKYYVKKNNKNINPSSNKVSHNGLYKNQRTMEENNPKFYSQFDIEVEE